MAMDTLENNQKKPPLVPSFPFFNCGLLRKGDFTLNIPESFSLVNISHMIQEKLHQDVNLNGDLGLFSSSEVLRTSGLLQHGVGSETLRATKKMSGDRANAIKRTKLSQAGKWRKLEKGEAVIRTKIASRQGQSKASSPNKMPRRVTQNELLNIPSLAALLSEDEDSSVGGDNQIFCQGLARYIDDFGHNGQFDELSETDESIGKKISRKCIESREKFLDEPFEIFDYETPIFNTHDLDARCANHIQMSNKWTKKIKSNPSELTFQSFSIFENLSENTKKDSFDFTLEQTTASTSYSQIESKLIESPTFGI